MFVVHCRIKPGGALNVLEALILKKIRSGQSVEAIFTLYSDREELIIDHGEGTIQIPIVTSLPHRLNAIFRRADRAKPWLISSLIDYRNLMPFFPLLMKLLSRKLQKRVDHLGLSAVAQGSKIGLSESECAILISSYAVAKNIDIPQGWTSEIYLHQPMHYIRTLYDEYVSFMSGRKKRLYQAVTPYLRRRDRRVRHYDIIYANSQSTKSQISSIYHLDKKHIQIVYPPIATTFFHERIVTVPDNYFFYINRLTRLFKHLDKLIHLCNRHQVPLIIAGDGPDKAYLQSIAGPTITFVGRISQLEDKIQLMKRAKGILNVAHESFGIVTAEALLLGIPIFGYQGGATPELVDTKSGVLTPSLDNATMDEYFSKFLSCRFDRKGIQDRARNLLSPMQEFRTS